MPAVILSVSITIPRKVSQVEGPLILEVLTGTLIFVHSRSMACRLFELSVEPGEPEVKTSSR